MIEILKNTPQWVYVVFTVVLYLGLASCFEGKASVRGIFILPAVFLLSSVYGLVTRENLGALTTIAWVTGFGITAVVLYRVTLVTGTGIRREQDHLIIPGDVSVLIVSMVFFSIKFWFGYKSAVDTDWSRQVSFQAIDSLTSGIVAGFFAGRSFGHYKIAKRFGL
ncbi:DUF6622 family protein [Mesorhizobium sp. NPDC059054]|uniref:DUF6622 family protein n=1 Tax=unclassified Mesorhizobium TaxID=325217 RepID=UPI0036A6D094